MSQQFYRKAGVQAAIVAGVFLIAATVLTILHTSKSEGTISNIQKIVGATNSQVTQVNQPSNATVNNNSGNVTFNNRGAATYQNITNNETLNASNITSNFQNAQFAPNGVPIFTPNANIGSLNVYVGGANENTQIETRLSQLETKYKDESTVEGQDILTLTKLVRELDRRTEDIQRLPDGRTSIGGVIAVGIARYTLNEYSNALVEYSHGDFLSAFKFSTNAINDIESTQTNWQWEVVYSPAPWKSQVYELAAVSALRIGENDSLSKYAKDAVTLNPTAQTESTFISALLFNASLEFQKKDYSNSFALFNNATTNYEFYSSNNTNLMSKQIVISLYQGLGASAWFLGKTNEAQEAFKKMTDVR